MSKECACVREREDNREKKKKKRRKKQYRKKAYQQKQFSMHDECKWEENSILFAYFIEIQLVHFG